MSDARVVFDSLIQTTDDDPGCCRMASFIEGDTETTEIYLNPAELRDLARVARHVADILEGKEEGCFVVEVS